MYEGKVRQHFGEDGVRMATSNEGLTSISVIPSDNDKQFFADISAV
jgi:hypothetical protein